MNLGCLCCVYDDVKILYNLKMRVLDLYMMLNY